VEEQNWSEFSFAALLGQWQGSLEISRNEAGKSSKKGKNEQRVNVKFLKAADFFAARQSVCHAVPADAIVLNGLFWGQGKAKEFEAFIPTEDDKVAYGRLSFEKLNGQEVCQFRRLGRVMGKNRLSLPAVSFSEQSTGQGRSLASADSRGTVSMEFLRFVPATARAQAFAADGRAPASAVERERPPLMIRVFQIHAQQKATGTSEWKSTEEWLYRLWKAN
jgi:hypothetical protein